MFGFTDAPRAWWLTRGMARIAGVNLTQAVVEGWLERRELAAIVARCDSCGAQGNCNRWLAHSGAATALPGFCPNKTSIEALSLSH